MGIEPSHRKIRFNNKLIYALYETAELCAKILHSTSLTCDWQFASDESTKLSFDPAESRFNVAALVVMIHESSRFRL